MTAVATYPQEAVLEPTAYEVIREFLPEMVRQFRAPCRQVGLESRIVFFNEEVSMSVNMGTIFWRYGSNL